MERIYIKDLKEKIGEEIDIFGWINIRRDHGKLIFFDLRDTSGMVQVVALPNHEEAHTIANDIRPEWVVRIRGKVNARPEKMCNEGLNGNLEIEALEIEVLNQSITPPFEVNDNTIEIDEDARLKYRYLDLRTERMHSNIKVRSDFVNRCRQYMLSQNFCEIETPLLTQGTAEGSRDFVIPSRLSPGKFYALPQSPQQYKQLIMTSGFDRYFQMARCIRDEDLRADRGFEHTQIDIEMSFVKQEDVMNMVEGMCTTVMEDMGYKVRKPFQRVTYAEAMEKYGADKFDVRTEEEKKEGILAFAWVTDFPFYEKTEDGKWTFTHNPFSMPDEDSMEDHMAGKNLENVKTCQYDLVCNGYECGGGSIRAHRPEILRATYKNMGYSDQEIEDSVGHMIEAFSYGAPPHGGIGMGIERLIMILRNEDALREVQAFPMTRGGKTSVMNGPSDLSTKQLQELHLKVVKEESKK